MSVPWSSPSPSLLSSASPSFPLLDGGSRLERERREDGVFREGTRELEGARPASPFLYDWKEDDDAMEWIRGRFC